MNVSVTLQLALLLALAQQASVICPVICRSEALGTCTYWLEPPANCSAWPIFAAEVLNHVGLPPSVALLAVLSPPES